MSDRERTNAEKSVADGEVSWNVHWEGHRGPIGNLWVVKRYPTVYVVDAARSSPCGIVAVLASLQTRISNFTLSNVLAEIDCWLETGRSSFQQELQAIHAGLPPPASAN